MIERDMLALSVASAIRVRFSIQQIFHVNGVSPSMVKWLARISQKVTAIHCIPQYYQRDLFELNRLHNVHAILGDPLQILSYQCNPIHDKSLLIYINTMSIIQTKPEIIEGIVQCLAILSRRSSFDCYVIRICEPENYMFKADFFKSMKFKIAKILPQHDLAIRDDMMLILPKGEHGIFIMQQFSFLS